VYFEKFEMVEEAFKREKQLQGWSRKKKEALIFGQERELPNLSNCKHMTNSKFYKKIPKAEKDIDPPQHENSNPSVVED